MILHPDHASIPDPVERARPEWVVIDPPTGTGALHAGPVVDLGLVLADDALLDRLGARRSRRRGDPDRLIVLLAAWADDVDRPEGWR